jgi:transcriptional regulator with XRE-family HTH domain
VRQRPRKQIQPDLGPEKAIGQAIREIRLEREMSQEQLAFECGFDRTYISLMERGIRSPTVRSLVKLASVLNVRPSEVLARMEALLNSKHTKARP